MTKVQTDKQSQLRILVLLGSIPLYGQERGNIEVLRTLKEEKEAKILFVTNAEWGHQNIQPELDNLGLPWTTARYAGRFGKSMGGKRWLRNLKVILIASKQLAGIAKDFQPSHIHVGNPAFFLNFLPWLMLKRTPIIYRSGDSLSLHNIFYRILWRFFIIPRVSHFVANSNFIFKSLVSAGIPPNKIDIIYSRPSKPKNIPNTSQKGVSTLSDDKIFLYVGQISRDKGVDLLVKAARKIINDWPNVSFWFAGDYSWQNPLAKKMIAKLKADNLENKIVFLGYRNDIELLFMQCDVHVCPSVWDEPLANVVLEAKQSAKPSIIFNSGGLPELIRHEIDGYCCKEKTAAELALAIQYYLKHPGEILNHGIAAQDSLDEVLKVQQFSKKWARVYYAAS